MNKDVLFGHPDYIHVPWRMKIEETRSLGLESVIAKQLSLYEQYAENKYGMPLTEVMETKKAILVIEVLKFQDGPSELEITLTNKGHLDWDPQPVTLS